MGGRPPRRGRVAAARKNSRHSTRRGASDRCCLSRPAPSRGRAARVPVIASPSALAHGPWRHHQRFDATSPGCGGRLPRVGAAPPHGPLPFPRGRLRPHLTPACRIARCYLVQPAALLPGRHVSPSAPPQQRGASLHVLSSLPLIICWTLSLVGGILS